MQITHVHHIAIATLDPNALAPFYRDVLGLPELRRLADERGLRSVWLNMAASGAMQILMLERSDAAAKNMLDQSAESAQSQWSSNRPETAQAQSYHWKRPGLHLLALGIHAQDRARWEERLHSLGVPIEDRSEFTLYVRDPEGNRIALSWLEDQPSASTSPTVEGPRHPAEPE